MLIEREYKTSTLPYVNGSEAYTDENQPKDLLNQLHAKIEHLPYQLTKGMRIHTLSPYMNLNRVGSTKRNIKQIKT